VTSDPVHKTFRANTIRFHHRLLMKSSSYQNDCVTAAMATGW